MAGRRVAGFGGGALMPREYDRDDLNRVVKKAAWRAQRNHQFIWGGLYDEMEKRSGKDIRALAVQHNIPRVTVLENLGLVTEAVKFIISKHGVRYE